MTRTGLDHDWVASTALALAHLEGTGERTYVQALLGRYDDAVTLYAALRAPGQLWTAGPAESGAAGPSVAAASLAGYADLADALVDICGEPEPIPGYGVSFVDINTGATMEPGDITDDEPGRAVVWGTQLTGCGVRGDREMADAMVAALETLPPLDAAYRLLCLVAGAGEALHTRYHIDAGDGRVVEALGGQPATYRAQCSDCGADLSTSGSRQIRDAIAARHVVHQSHVVRRWAE